MIIKNLTMLFGDRETPNSRETAVTHVIEEDSTTIPIKFRNDVDALKSKFGDVFKTGSHIELSLTDSLLLMPRDRKRTDAYHTLQVWLKENYDITLIIKSRKGNKNEVSIS